MELKREDFPSVYEMYEKDPRRIDRFENMLDILNAAMEQGSIRNAVFKDVKEVAGRLCEDSLEYLVKDPFFYGRANEQPEELLDLYYKMYISGAHILTSLKKRIDKLTIDNDCSQAMKKWINEFIPFTNALESLKPNVVKGRAAREEPAKPVNPNKDVKTCPCCFRPIAVVAGTMAHHGYQRTGHGYQTESCPGIQFKPLELSPDGLHFMLKSNQESKAESEKLLAEAPEIISFKEIDRIGIKRELVDITREDRRFQAYYDRHVRELQSNITFRTRDIAMFEELIANWKPDMKHKQAESASDSPSP